MPVMDLLPLDFDPPRIDFARVKVAAYMLWPSDDEARKKFLVSCGMQFAAALATTRGVALTIEPSATDVMKLVGDPLAKIDAATDYVIQGAVKAPEAPKRTAGFIAGELLLYAIDGERAKPGSVGLGSAAVSLSKFYRGLKNAPQNARHQDIEKVWHVYRPSAHLWAAKLSWDMAAKTDEGSAVLGDADELIPSGLDRVKAFLFWAERLRREGEAIKHKQATQALLLGDVAWRLSDELARRLEAEAFHWPL